MSIRLTIHVTPQSRNIDQSGRLGYTGLAYTGEYPVPRLLHLPSPSVHDTAGNLRNQPEIIVRTPRGTTAAHYNLSCAKKRSDLSLVLRRACKLL